MPLHASALTQLAPPRAFGADCLCDLANVGVRRCHYQNVARLTFKVRLGLPLKICVLYFLSAILPSHFTNSAHAFELVEAAFRVVPQFPDCSSITLGSLPLNSTERDAFQPRFLFQYAKSIAGLDAANLLRIAAEDNSH